MQDITQANVSAPSLRQINAPSCLSRIADMKSGLVLISGATGSGKSSTLMALMDDINTKKTGRIISIEDIIEFSQDDKNCQLDRREIALKPKYLRNFLKEALADKPDFLMIDELRVGENMRLIADAVDSGLLVIATVHGRPSVTDTVRRFVDMMSISPTKFTPGFSKEESCDKVSRALSAVISQGLASNAHTEDEHENALVPAYEIMFATPEIRKVIKVGAFDEILPIMQKEESQRMGMCTLDQSIEALIDQDKISPYSHHSMGMY